MRQIVLFSRCPMPNALLIKIPLAAFIVQLGGLNKEWVIEFQYSS
ncbi:hypothetical protein [Scytonema hofmannii]|nr:hypothetical protein [Scytonema hofmannii]